MNVTSLFRDTASQLAIGAGKVINNIVDFLSNFSSGITSIFNSNTSFRQVSTESRFVSYTTTNFNSNDNESGECSFNNFNCFLDGKLKIDNIEGHIYEKVDNVEENIYEEIDEEYLNLIRNSSKLGDEKEPLIVNDEYDVVFDRINISSEGIYSEPYSNDYSDENIYDVLPTESEIMKLWSSLPKDKTKFNTI